MISTSEMFLFVVLMFMTLCTTLITQKTGREHQSQAGAKVQLLESKQIGSKQSGSGIILQRQKK
jgi:hypothetical protein